MKTETVHGDDRSRVDSDLTVGVLRGGTSEEREISLKTGQAVIDGLSDRTCDVREYDTSTDLGERLDSDGVDVVFIALHGKRGEDGTVQALLEWRGIPYTGPGPRASALCMDKLRTRQVFDDTNVPGPDWFVLRDAESVRNKKNFGRMVVKPRAEGSSLGMTITDEEGFEEAVDTARTYDDDVIVEEYVEGYEVTVGVFQDVSSTRILPPVGIQPDHPFFDYDTKYTRGLTEYHVPARLDSDERRRLKDLTGTIVTETETRELSRVDFIRDDQGEFRLLEINTIPGLTETSLLPKAALEAGIDFDELIWHLVETAWRQRECQPT